MARKAKKRYTEDGKLIQNTTIKVRLYPTASQAAFFDTTFGCCRYLWNQMLSDEREFYAATGEHFLPTPARYKASAPFLKEADSQALVNVHQNLRLAFQRFFDNPEHYRYPVFKKKKDGKNAYTIYCNHYKSGKGASIYLTDNSIRLPKIGLVKARLHRKPLHWWKLKTATVSRSPSGKYFCSLLYECAVKEPEPVIPATETTLGLNYSPTHFYLDSEGRKADPPHWLGQSQEKLRKLQQQLSRMERGSNNYEKQIQKIRLLHEHIANQRKDFVHKESRRITNAYDAVCVRDTDLQEMSKKYKTVLDSGFGIFRECLAYKLERQGKSLVLVDHWEPTAKKIRDQGLAQAAIA